MQSFFYQSLRLAATGVVAAGVTLLAGAAQAQTTGTMALLGSDPARTTYAGPRFPGGPDSLRAVLGRTLRPASPDLAGQLFLNLELTSAGTVQRASLLPPPSGTPAAKLAKNQEVQTLVSQVVQRLPAWQPGPGAPGQNKATLNMVVLPLTLGPSVSAPTLPYGDENPTFPAAKGDQRSGVTGFLQKQIRYPANDLRNQVQGTVYAYFEVSETGAVEQRRVVGSVSPTLDAEVQRVLALLPNALTPPRLAGRPVRVGYVLPLNFRIQ